MATTDNGWPASPNLKLRPLVVAGESFTPGIVDNDDVYVILRYVAEQMHERVEPIVRDDWHQADDWGFSYRPNRNANSLSRHSGGIAIDYNATRHPNGVPTARTFSTRQIGEIRTILRELDGVVRWGGDYRGTPDAMHFEIDVRPNDPRLKRVANKIRNKEDPMADYEGQLNRLERKIDKMAQDNTRRHRADLKRTKRIIKKLTGVEVDLAELEKALDEE